MNLPARLYFCCAFTKLEPDPDDTPEPNSAREMPARIIEAPIKTRRLKKADCEADFFFMVLEEVATSRCDVSGELSGERGRPIRSCFVLGRVHDSFRVWNVRFNRSAENVSTLFFGILKKFEKPRLTRTTGQLRGVDSVASVALRMQAGKTYMRAMRLRRKSSTSLESLSM